MIDDNIDTLYDDYEASSSCGFDSETYETEFDAYETEVDNKVWINELIKDIDLEELA